MDEIVRYQLRKPATSQADSLVLTLVPVKAEIERLVEGLNKVYHDKGPDIETQISEDMQFRGESGDFLEMAGNLIDNACKWCERKVLVTVQPASGAKSDGGMILQVADDGPGVPGDAVDALLERGTRLDESTPGHGIGLAVVKELAESYGGELAISKSELGGAKFRVTIPASS
jgi:two-component system sensor histidine kinase PhoQ